METPAQHSRSPTTLPDEDSSSTAQPMDAASERSLLRLFWPVSLVFLIVTASGSEMPPGPGIPGFDKVVHLLLFGLLATHLCRYPARPAARLRLPQAIFAVAVTTAFGLSDELHQAMNPHRTFDLLDLLADFLGACIAVACYQHWHLYRSLLEFPLFGRRRRTL